MINTSKKLSGLFLLELKNRFKTIAGEDQLIDRDEFKNGLLISNKMISNRLFDLFDKDSSGFIDFEEFVGTMESLISGDNKSKIKFAFDLHDLDNNGFIDRSELKVLIEESFNENNLEYDHSQVDLLVNEFFNKADIDKSGTIDFSEFLKAAKRYPEFIDGFTVNPIYWLIPDRYEKKNKHNLKNFKKNKLSKIQVQDIGLLKSLLVPKLIFLYNIILNRNRKKINCLVSGFKLLPSNVMEIELSVNKDFQFMPGDYVYLNSKKISMIDWHPFIIISKSKESKILLNIKVNDRWTNKLYKQMLETHRVKRKFNQQFKWEFSLDGPYGSSSKNILESKHVILVGAGHGISKFAPILKDINFESDSRICKLKKIDLYWLIFDQSYFEWFTKIINDFKKDNKEDIFNYHIYFVDKSPDQLNNKLLYVSKDILNRETKVKLIDDLWSNSNFGYPNWSEELKKTKSENNELESNLFFSGPSIFIKDLKKTCKKLKINFNDEDY